LRLPLRHHPRVTLLAVKVLLAPGFVVLASLAGRRFGARVGGMLGGLPVVAAPILLVYALAHGDRFAAHASAATVLGLVSLMGFVIVYAWLAHYGRRWWASLLAGWAVFATFTYLFSLIEVSAALALLVMGVVLLAAPVLLPRVRAAENGEAQRLPSWDLPLRAAAALALVLALTAAAGWLGPQVSGLLAPFPVIASVLAVFTHTQRGQAEVLRLLRGLLLGYAAYALFCFLLAVTLPSLGTAASFLLATSAALLCQAVILWRQRRLIARGVTGACGSPSLQERQSGVEASPPA
jgi:hypothetical protein